MPDSLNGLPPRFCARLRPPASSVSPAGRWRSIAPTGRDRVPKIGGRVVYALDDLKAWADIGAKISTSDPGVGTVLPAKRGAVARTAMNNAYKAPDVGRLCHVTADHAAGCGDGRPRLRFDSCGSRSAWKPGSGSARIAREQIIDVTRRIVSSRPIASLRSCIGRAERLRHDPVADRHSPRRHARRALRRRVRRSTRHRHSPARLTLAQGPESPASH